MTMNDERRAELLDQELRACCDGAAVDAALLWRVCAVMSHHSMDIVKTALVRCEHWDSARSPGRDALRAMLFIAVMCGR